MDISTLYGSSGASALESLYEKQTEKKDTQDSLVSSWGKDTVRISGEAMEALKTGNASKGEDGNGGGSSGSSSSGSNESQVSSLKSKLSSLQGKLSQAAGSEASSINAEISALTAEIASLEAGGA